MQPYSLLFVLFVATLVVVHRIIGRSRWRSYQWVVLLAGSMGFYLWSDARSFGFLLVTSLTTWLAGKRMRALDEACDAESKTVANRKERKAVRQAFQKRRWHVLLATLILNFGILGYVKYWNTLLGYVHLDQGFLASRLLLPLGISFYTFTSLGYLIDVYNKKVEPEENYAHYLLFVSWFPQLIQGPINRWAEMRDQLSTPRDVSDEDTRRALLLILYGALKKYALADTLVGAITACLDFIDYSTPGAVIVIGIVLYSLQQYGDFSGGIDMVEGVSELFGVRMAQNFRQPYFSTSLAEFWRRWHMSLGEWMRAYVFYPLAMRPSMMSLNKWGTKHLGKTVGRTLEESASWRAWGIVRTFALVNLGRYFDRLVDPRALLIALRNTVCNFRPSGILTWLGELHTTPYLRTALILSAVACLMVLVVDIRTERGEDVAGEVLALSPWRRLLLYVGVVTLILLSFVAAATGGGFLYANF